jgi:hypothetical protein
MIAAAHVFEEEGRTTFGLGMARQGGGLQNRIDGFCHAGQLAGLFQLLQESPQVMVGQVRSPAG